MCYVTSVHSNNWAVLRHKTYLLVCRKGNSLFLRGFVFSNEHKSKKTIRNGAFRDFKQNFLYASSTLLLPFLFNLLAFRWKVRGRVGTEGPGLGTLVPFHNPLSKPIGDLCSLLLTEISFLLALQFAFRFLFTLSQERLFINENVQGPCVCV